MAEGAEGAPGVCGPSIKVRALSADVTPDRRRTSGRRSRIAARPPGPPDAPGTPCSAILPSTTLTASGVGTFSFSNPGTYTLCYRQAGRTDSINQVAVSLAVAAAGVGNDPIAWYGDLKRVFVLPPGELVPLLKAPDMTLSGPTDRRRACVSVSPHRCDFMPYSIYVVATPFAGRPGGSGGIARGDDAFLPRLRDDRRGEATALAVSPVSRAVAPMRASAGLQSG